MDFRVHRLIYLRIRPSSNKKIMKRIAMYKQQLQNQKWPWMLARR